MSLKYKQDMIIALSGLQSLSHHIVELNKKVIECTMRLDAIDVELGKVKLATKTIKE